MTGQTHSEDSLVHFGLAGNVDDPSPEVLGAKGANLVTMTNIGLPVPPGFIISTQIGELIASGQDELPDGLWGEIKSCLAMLEENMGRKFAAADKPLLLSVRSGASVSMPGMMDTVLNLGLNDTTVEALAVQTNDPRFAWDSYRRFVQSYSQVVLGIDGDEFEDVLDEMRIRTNVETDAELPADAIKEITGIFLQVVRQVSGKDFPQDVYEQLAQSLLAVFRSWNSKRATRYREIQNLDHAGGTAAIVQAMVFGNRNEHSCSGVYFTRNPSTGDSKPYGEYIPNSQGEDVVAGIRTPWELTESARVEAYSDYVSMEKKLPEAYAQLLEMGATLEKKFHDMQEIEFTVEDGRLFLLQTRGGKRTPKAGMKIAVEMAESGLITRRQAVEKSDMGALEATLVSKVEARSNATLLTKGLPASPGAACGAIVFSSQDAEKYASQSKPCILVRPETDPKDVHGMHAADGILTTRGGMTSHAAVVARGMGKPCITAAMTLKIDVANQICSCAGKVLQAGDIITIDGGSGHVFLDEQPTIMPEPDGDLAKLFQWQKELLKPS